jgi:Uma2 family endonuclease
MAYTLAMESVVKQVVESPRLYKQLHDLLEAEKSRRKYFHDHLQQYEGQKVEFIAGEVTVHMPVKKRHADCKRRAMNLLGNYVYSKKIGFVGDEKILVSLSRNDYEPDICFFTEAKAASFTPEQTTFPAPDFIVEILSEGTEAKDRGIKFEDYAAHGVKEYWILDPVNEILEQYLLVSDQYELVFKGREAEVSSQAIHGLTISIKALFDDAENMQALQQLLRRD